MNKSQTFCPEVSEELKSTTISNLKKVNKLKKDSGLHWDQMAYLFGLNSRGIHAWASGQSLSHENEEKLNSILEVVEYISRGSARQNRILLTEYTADGEISCLDLLKRGDYDRVKSLLGFGGVPRLPILHSTQPVAKKTYTSPSPGDLVDALQDPIHYEVGEVRLAKVVRRQQT